MFEKIIIASELPKDMEVFIRSLGDLKKIGTKECIVLQCIEPDDMLSQLIQMLKEAYQGNLDREIEILKELGFEVSGQLIEGELKYVINRLATEENCDLIVVGSRKTNKFGDPIWGGAAHEVIHRPSKPILQIRIHNKVAEDEAVLEKEDLFRHVLFPTDFSENAEKIGRFSKKCRFCENNVTENILHLQARSIHTAAGVKPRVSQVGRSMPRGSCPPEF